MKDVFELLALPFGMALVILSLGAVGILAQCHGDARVMCRETCGDRGVARVTKEECVCR